jgi:hypothetical protein
MGVLRHYGMWGKNLRNRVGEDYVHGSSNIVEDSKASGWVMDLFSAYHNNFKSVCDIQPSATARQRSLTEKQISFIGTSLYRGLMVTLVDSDLFDDQAVKLETTTRHTAPESLPFQMITCPQSSRTLTAS